MSRLYIHYIHDLSMGRRDEGAGTILSVALRATLPAGTFTSRRQKTAGSCLGVSILFLLMFWGVDFTDNNGFPRFCKNCKTATGIGPYAWYAGCRCTLVLC